MYHFTFKCKHCDDDHQIEDESRKAIIDLAMAVAVKFEITDPIEVYQDNDPEPAFVLQGLPLDSPEGRALKRELDLQDTDTPEEEALRELQAERPTVH